MSVFFIYFARRLSSFNDGALPSRLREGPGVGLNPVTYGDVFLENERQFSAYNFETADTASLFDRFRQAADECRRCLDAQLPLPAYDQAIKASHIFNTLQARGVISVAERAAYLGRVRDLAKGACASWMEKNGWAP